VSCLGCCWALMLVMFGTGVGSLAWMVGLTAVMVVEKTSRYGARLVTPVGAALLAAAGAVAASDLLVPHAGHGDGLAPAFVALLAAGVVLALRLLRRVESGT
jgi:hypothetical protein